MKYESNKVIIENAQEALDISRDVQHWVHWRCWHQLPWWVLQLHQEASIGYVDYRGIIQTEFIMTIASAAAMEFFLNSFPNKFTPGNRMLIPTSDTIHGGWACLEKVHMGVSANKLVPYGTFVGFPSSQYNLEYLDEKMNDYFKIYGERDASPG